MAKGSAYEREVCGLLSLWWTDGQRDDVFWRTHGSGGRANVRARRGRRTAGQYGDIGAVDDCGKALTDLLAVELKRGYNSDTIQAVLDRTDGHALNGMEEHLAQAVAAANRGGAYAWLLVHRRDRRRAYVFMPQYALQSLRSVGAFAAKPQPLISFTAMIRYKGGGGAWHTIAGMTLDDFLAGCRPAHIRALAEVA